MDARVVAFYRRIYADRTIASDEATELQEFLNKLNPPPDKIIWMRSTAFRIASEFISDTRDNNLDLIKTTNYIVHAIESICMEPKELAYAKKPFDAEAATEFYKGLYSDLSIDRDENVELLAFFRDTKIPDKESLTKARFLAFKVASEFLSDDDKDANTNLFRCMNSIVHAFETSCLQPKPFQLKDERTDLSMSISDAAQHLWKLDENRLDPSRDYTINVQSGKKPYWNEDMAEEPFFSRVDKRAFQRRTYATFIALLDNYSPQTGSSEVVTRAEEKEMQAFLCAIMETKPMQFCHRYCCAKDNSIPKDRSGFVKLLFNIWFELYRRGSSNDSSGFEHVFVGEIKKGEISGFHNWIQLYLEEQKGAVDYKGYIKPRSCDDANVDDSDHLLTLQFTWNGVPKTVGSSFIGVSPEFEFALYTMCFLVGEEKNPIRLATGGVEKDTFDLEIVCYKMAKDKVGTCYPEVKSHWEE